jgi:hypothetical protein
MEPPIRALRVVRPGSGRRELASFALAYLTYFGVRALTPGAVPRAVRNALEVMRVERGLRIEVEASVQARR